ncbi:WbqC family protein [Candidatus Pacearchaeota archaeon]|nr:WbqC family protein [Candidatus Pacearchaeota archaeon]
MILAAHQPHYMPWLGYLDKMAKSEIFVIVDHVQYEDANYQNRQRFKFPNGVSFLIVPLKKASQKDIIIERKIETSPIEKQDWRRRHWTTIEQNYSRTPYFRQHADELRAVYEQPWENLIDLNLHMLELARKWYGIEVPLIGSSTLNLQGQKTDMILDMCRKVKADTYLSGKGGSTGYLDVERMNKEGVKVIWQEFNHPEHPQRYPQQGFVKGLGFIDYIFNCGGEKAKALFKNSHSYLEARS